MKEPLNGEQGITKYDKNDDIATLFEKLNMPTTTKAQLCLTQLKFVYLHGFRRNLTGKEKPLAKTCKRRENVIKKNVETIGDKKIKYRFQ